MLSKTAVRATALAMALLALSCSRVLPWGREPVDTDVSLAFTLDRNLVRLDTVSIDGREGAFLLGTAAPRTVVDTNFPLAAGGRHLLQLRERESLRLQPYRLDLGGVADAIIGAETWGRYAVSIDYHTGLVTYQKQGIRTGFMTIFHYEVAPKIYVNVNGIDVAALVDTASPDTVVLPRRTSGREDARVVVAGTDFGTIDVQYADVSEARVGNRILSRFLVTVDYGRRVVGLWRDPRIPLHDTDSEIEVLADVR
jgi:hypothetical protein